MVSAQFGLNWPNHRNAEPQEMPETTGNAGNHSKMPESTGNAVTTGTTGNTNSLNNNNGYRLDPLSYNG
jgi:hypothetical protein